jgi:hypothetical protein
LDSLSLEQLVALVNILGDFILLMTLMSITSVLFGDYLINKLKLESRYPRISKYIRMKERLNKYYLMFYIVLFYFLLIFCIIGNIYMLVLKYFV